MLKKKESIVKDSGQVAAAAKKVAKKEAQKPNGKKSKSVYSWTYQLALLVIIAFAAAYAAVDVLSLSQNEKAFNEALNQDRLASVSKTVDDYVRIKKQAVRSLAVNEAVFSPTASQLKHIWPDLSSFLFISNKNIQTARQSHPELTFANVDLLRRAANQGQALAEFFFNDDSWYMQVAAPATNVKTKDSSENVAIAIFNLSAIESLLKASEAAKFGSIKILSGPNRAVFSLGNDSSSESIKSNVDIAGVSISYVPSGSKIFVIDRVMVLAPLLSLGLLLAIIQILLSRKHMRDVRKDILQIGPMVSKLISGSKKKGEFVYGEFSAMSQSVAEQISLLVDKVKKLEKASLNVHKEEEKNTLPNEDSVLGDDDPLFDGDELDLDGLDDPVSDESNEMLSEVEGLEIDVPQSIFRAYDIRGIVDQTLNEGLVELIGKAVASEAILQGQKAICVGYDARHSSFPYSEALIRGILSTGIDVVNVGQVPTPVLYFSTHHLNTGSGVMITGSHNPANYNGFKILLDGKTLCGDDIQKIYNRILLQDFEAGEGVCTEKDVSEEYMDTILNDIAVAAPLKVVLDAGNGVAGRIAPQLIEELGCEVIPLHCEVDGNFPNHHPDPSNPENLKDLIASVQEQDADIGLAFDGDADRIGVVTNTGKIIWPDRLLMLFAKDVVSRNPGADILFDVKCSRRLNGLISSYGGRPVMWKSGHSFIKAKMSETGALLAGEMSGHIFFKERWFGFDDGLYCAARLLEVLGIEDRSSDEVFADFPEDVNTPEINITVSDESKFTIVESLCALKDQFEGGNTSTIDGLRVEYPNGWGLCRASNTTPSLMFRFEADDEAALEEIKSIFKSKLQIVDPSLVCDF